MEKEAWNLFAVAYMKIEKSFLWSNATEEALLLKATGKYLSSGKNLVV